VRSVVGGMNVALPLIRRVSPVFRINSVLSRSRSTVRSPGNPPLLSWQA
jgi:hypothetical protein